jgi:regulatory protein YycI of two-component signal transduction system YycFG
MVTVFVENAFISETYRLKRRTYERRTERKEIKVQEEIYKERNKGIQILEIVQPQTKHMENLCFQKWRLPNRRDG